MPTLYGPWQAGGEARIEVDYNVVYNAEKTAARYDLSFYYATAYSVVDSVNSWSVSGNLGTFSGSNVPINHGSGGGRKLFCSISIWWDQGPPSVSAAFAGVEAQGQTITAGFSIPTDPLAPSTDSNYSASNIGITTATVGGFGAYGHGSSLNNTQTQFNTSPVDAGSTIVTRGSYGNSMDLTNLVGGLTYHYRMRVSNTGYGYGPWGSWKTFTTLPGVFVNVGGVWKNATPYVRVGGVWRQAIRYVKVNGVWKS